ncbi:MAG: hypothetical protein KC561_13650, partial [Myxococcales bacterium]|nr:hypothetical protein [Myxococcales bacterium]
MRARGATRVPLIGALILIPLVVSSLAACGGTQTRADLEPEGSGLSAGIEGATRVTRSGYREANQTGLFAEIEQQLVDGHSVRQVLVDGPGDAWIATGGGLFRVRNYIFTERFMTSNGLRSNRVQSINLGADGALWATFEGGGCQLVLNGELRDCPWGAQDAAFLAATAEGIVLARRSGEIVLLDETGSPTRQTELGTAWSLSGLVSCADSFWISTRGGGLFRLDPTSWRVTPVEDSPVETRVIEALTCHEGSLVVGGPMGAYRVWGHLPETSIVPLGYWPGPVRVSGLAADAEDLIAANAAGAVRVLSDSGAATEINVPMTVAAIGIDRAGLWLGGEDGLIWVGDDGAVAEVTLPGPGSNDISDIAANQNQLAVALFRGGVAAWRDGHWSQFGTDDGLPSGDVNAIAFDRNGRLWVATSRGLVAIEDGRVMASFGSDWPCQSVWRVLEDPDAQTLILGTGCGVGEIDPGTGVAVRWEERPAGLPHPSVFDLALWNGQIVAGTLDGLALRTGTDPERPWESIRAGRSPLTDNWITALEVQGDRLWIGSYSGGMFYAQVWGELVAVGGSKYINLGAVYDAGEAGLLVGGLEEGTYVARSGFERLEGLPER